MERMRNWICTSLRAIAEAVATTMQMLKRARKRGCMLRYSFIEIAREGV
jgi:hypothetical protein